MRANPINIHTINIALRIPEYKILLPESLSKHRTARIIVYVRDSVSATKICTNADTSGLPIIMVKAKKGKEAPTNVIACYREYTGAASGLSSMQAQADRLSRTLEAWREVESKGNDTIIVGDINLDYINWTQQGSPQHQLIDQVKSTQIQATLTQMVTKKTRFQLVNGLPQSSTIDHVYTNCPDKLKEVDIIPVGDSDHQGQVVTKLTNIPQEHPQSYRIRVHKPLSGDALRQDLVLNNIN